MKSLRLVLASLVVLCLSSSVRAQTDLSTAVKQPNWNFGVFAVGGTGLLENSDIQNFGVGTRLGRVFCHERGTGFLRGTLEWNAEILPFHQFYGRGPVATGGIINPVVVKWNLTRGSRVIPFFEVVGGAIFTNENFPPGDTASINFNSGAGIGMNVFTKDRRSVTVDVRALHISNASIGNHNPGVNASLHFTIGYTWWK